MVQEVKMSKNIEGLIECPFYVKEGERFITCEGLLENSTVTHRFTTNEEKKCHEFDFCCVNAGKKCPHYRNVSLLYERGQRA